MNSTKGGGVTIGLVGIFVFIFTTIHFSVVQAERSSIDDNRKKLNYIIPKVEALQRKMLDEMRQTDMLLGYQLSEVFGQNIEIISSSSGNETIRHFEKETVVIIGRGKDLTVKKIPLHISDISSLDVITEIIKSSKSHEIYENLYEVRGSAEKYQEYYVSNHAALRVIFSDDVVGRFSDMSLIINMTFGVVDNIESNNYKSTALESLLNLLDSYY